MHLDAFGNSTDQSCDAGVCVGTGLSRMPRKDYVLLVTSASTTLEFGHWLQQTNLVTGC